MPEEDEPNPEEIRAEIKALEDVLEVLEGEDRKIIQEEIEVLKLALEGMEDDAEKFGEKNPDLVKFDVNKLDEFEKFQFNNLIKSLSKADALQVLINNVEGDYSQLSSDLAKIAERQKYAEGGEVGGEKQYEIRDYNDNYVGRYNDAQLIEWAKSLADYRKESIYINSVKDALMYIESPDRKGEQIFEVYHYGKSGEGVERNNYAEGGEVSRGKDLFVGDMVKILPNYVSIYTNAEGQVVKIMPDNRTYEIKIKHKAGNEYVNFDRYDLVFLGNNPKNSNAGGVVEKNNYAKGGGVGNYQVYYMDNDGRKVVLATGLTYMSAVKLSQKYYSQEGLSTYYEMKFAKGGGAGGNTITNLKDFDPNTTEIIDGDANFGMFPNITDLGVLFTVFAVAQRPLSL